MSSISDRWEKDPFFAAAEEVQNAADRLDSVYRRWVAGSTSPDVQRELHSALGTAKWQLEELDRAVKLNDDTYSAGEDTRIRHKQFFEAIGSQISSVENDFKIANLAEGQTTLTWVHLDEDERDELAIFLSTPRKEREEFSSLSSVVDSEIVRISPGESKNILADGSKNSLFLTDPSLSEITDDKKHVHRRVASACAEISLYNILIPSGGEDTSDRSFDDRTAHHMTDSSSSETTYDKKHAHRRVISSMDMNSVVCAKSRSNWCNTGFRKWRGNQHDLEELIPLQTSETVKGIDSYNGKVKSSLGTKQEEIFDKELYGGMGACRSQRQRSSYQIRYGSFVRYIFVAAILVSLILVYWYMWSVETGGS